MLTPQKIRNHKFPECTDSAVFAESVYTYLNEIADDYETMFAENTKMYQKLMQCLERIEEYQKDEEILRNAGITAKELANSIVKNAQREAEAKAEKITAEAELKAYNAEQIAMEKINIASEKTAAAIEIAKNARTQAQDIILELQNSIDSFKTQITDSYQKQLQSIDSISTDLPSLNLLIEGESEE